MRQLTIQLSDAGKLCLFSFFLGAFVRLVQVRWASSLGICRQVQEIRKKQIMQSVSDKFESEAELTQGGIATSASFPFPGLAARRASLAL